MRSCAALVLSLILSAAPAAAQEFGGLKVRGSSAGVATFSAPISLGAHGRDRYAKFRRPNGHDLSVTTRDQGAIIYMESNRNPDVPPVAGPGLQFGVTTRGELRALMGQDGFAYDTRTRFFDDFGAIVLFHSYELANQPGVVMTFGFRLPSERFGWGEDAAVLEALIVAELWYLDEIWGPAKTVSPGYAPVTVAY